MGSWAAFNANYLAHLANTQASQHTNTPTLQHTNTPKHEHSNTKQIEHLFNSRSYEDNTYEVSLLAYCVFTIKARKVKFNVTLKGRIYKIEFRRPKERLIIKT